MIYGEWIQIDWVDYIREEQKFSSVDQLVQQIQDDIVTAEEMLRTIRYSQMLFTS